jgi:hypothetical protein
MATERDQLVTPLRVVATLAESVVATHPVMLDALLMAVVGRRLRVLPPMRGEPGDPLPIPIATSECGRFYLCSQGFSEPEWHEVRHKHRRAPVSEMARLGTSKLRRVDIAAGANKSLRIPYVCTTLRRDTIEWWCLGDADQIRDLLSDVRYLGKHTGSGKGKLRAPWIVESCEPWEGFPVLRDGQPLRPLPADYPGAIGGRQGYRPVSPPYWDQSRSVQCLLPTESVSGA